MNQVSFSVVICMMVLLCSIPLFHSKSVEPRDQKTGGVFGRDFQSVEPREAYHHLSVSNNSFLIDVRTYAEYKWNSNPLIDQDMQSEMNDRVIKVPLLLWSKEHGMKENPTFLKDVLSQLRQFHDFNMNTSKVFCMCCCGGRSQTCTKELGGQGIQNVFNVLHGFDGDLNEVGQRNVNGWKADKLPYVWEDPTSN